MKFLGSPSSGSEQGQTSSRSRFGQYKRSRRSPVNPNTQPQSLARARLATASQAWRGLTEATRVAWNSYAGSVPRQDALGQTVFPTGAQVFIGLYVTLVQAGLTVPPSVPTTSAPAAVIITAASATTAPAVDITPTVAPTAALVAIVDASPQVSAGVAFNQDYRFVQKLVALNAGQLRVGGAYQTKFGTPISGKKIFLRVRYVTAAGGVSTPAFVSVIVA
jgi:hypothetical protein